MENRLHRIARLSIAAMASFAFAAPLLAQSTDHPSLSGRPVTAQELVGVWGIVSTAGVENVGYMAFLADGRCGSLALGNPPFGEKYAFTSREVIEQIDRQIDRGASNGWRTCSLEDGGLTQAPVGNGVAIHYAAQIAIENSEDQTSLPDSRIKPGDIRLQQYYKFDKNPPPWVHVLQPAPILLRRVTD
jgi:hypothetical protein